MQPNDGQEERQRSLAGFIHHLVNKPPSVQGRESAETTPELHRPLRPGGERRSEERPSLFHPVEPSRASGQVVEQVCDLVRSGKLHPGERLPPERDLVEILQVGRSTLREALRLLESLGLVETRPGEGTFLTSDQVPLVILPRPVPSGAGEEYIWETRLLLEPQIAALAAQRVTPADLKVLTTILRMQAEQVAAGRPGRSADLGFHTALCQVTRNPVLERLFASLDQLQREQEHLVQQVPGRLARSLRDHEGILEAVEAHDARLARHRMTKHLEGARRLVQRFAPSPPTHGGPA